MSTQIADVRYSCDWINESGETCGHTESFAGFKHEEAARKAGWGSYSNAAIRWIRWDTMQTRLWFCPIHAEVFGANHGWGYLENYGPPKRQHRGFWRRSR